MFDAAIVPQLQFRRAGAGLQALQSPADAGRELAGVAEAHRRRRIGRSACRERRTRAAVQIDGDDGALGFPLLHVRKNLARPHREPTIGELDLPHRHRTRVRESQQQRMTVGRIARDADRVGQQVVGDRRDGALEHFGQPVIRVELAPEWSPARRGARGRAPARAACRRTIRAGVSWASRPAARDRPRAAASGRPNIAPRAPATGRSPGRQPRVLDRPPAGLCPRTGARAPCADAR